MPTVIPWLPTWSTTQMIFHAPPGHVSVPSECTALTGSYPFQSLFTYLRERKPLIWPTVEMDPTRPCYADTSKALPNAGFTRRSILLIDAIVDSMLWASGSSAPIIPVQWRFATPYTSRPWYLTNTRFLLESSALEKAIQVLQATEMATPTHGTAFALYHGRLNYHYLFVSP